MNKNKAQFNVPAKIPYMIWDFPKSQLGRDYHEIK